MYFTNKNIKHFSVTGDKVHKKNLTSVEKKIFVAFEINSMFNREM